jgi:uncharacterized membrane protein SpoIIM required for sporulation
MPNTSIIKTYYRESLQSVSEARTCIFIAIALYCCAAFLGWTHADHFSFLEEQIKRLAAQFAGKRAIAFIFKIFLHNLIATYVAMCFVVLFGVVPTIIAVFNGLILGWIIAKSPGGGATNIWLVLIPHGIFEWPAMMIAWGVGLWRGLGHRFSKTGSTWRERWETANKVYFTITMPLLFIAAVIEGRYHIFKELSGIVFK